MDTLLLDKYRGTLVGGAVGDALGYAVEYMDEDAIFSKYGKNGITEYTLKDNKAVISDDTQMTIFTADGILLSAGCNINQRIESIRACYKDWANTQIGEINIGMEGHSTLMDVPELFTSKIPELTCLNAIGKGASGTIKNPINNSKESNGIIRTSPIGLYFKDVDLRRLAMFAAKVSAMTHGHPLGYISSAAFAIIINQIVHKNLKVEDAVRKAQSVIKDLFDEEAYTIQLLNLIDKAIDLSKKSIHTMEAIHILGKGWSAEETLCIGIFCSMRFEDNFEKGIVASVNHNGNSDTTGAITGNILGAVLGENAIPEKYKKKL